MAKQVERETGAAVTDPGAIPDKLYFRIGEVAVLCGVETHVLRFWQTEFPQLAPKKSGAGQRLYRKRDVEMALRIKQLLHEQGYTIAGARQVFAAEMFGPRRQTRGLDLLLASPAERVEPQTKPKPNAQPELPSGLDASSGHSTDRRRLVSPEPEPETRAGRVQAGPADQLQAPKEASSGGAEAHLARLKVDLGELLALLSAEPGMGAVHDARGANGSRREERCVGEPSCRGNLAEAGKDD